MEQTRLAVRVQPNARSNQVVGVDGDSVRIRVAAAPQRGEANAALIAYLSEVLDIRKQDVTIVHGLASRRKLLSIEGLGRAEVLRRLLAVTKGRRTGT